MMLASLLCVIFIQGTKPTMFKKWDLLIVNGELNGTIYKNRAALCSGEGRNHSLTQVNVMTLTNRGSNANPEYAYDYGTQVHFSNEALRPLSIKESKLSSNQQALSIENRWRIQCTCDAFSHVIEAQSKEEPIKDTSFLAEDLILCFGMIAHEFFISGLYYSFNYLSKHDFSKNVTRQFSESFCDHYVKKNENLLANSAIANSIGAGDLVRIKPLKPQKNESLQILVQHFGGSFGEIISFTSGDLIRKNSRNQTEFAVQSSSDGNMKLGLRPKYLCKITKIYVHEVSGKFSFLRFRELVLSLLSDPNKEILYLPLALMDRFSIFMLQQRHRPNLIFDVAVAASIGVIQTNRCPQKVSDFSSWFLSFPFFMTADIWNRVIEEMKMTSNPTKMIKKINEHFVSATSKYMKMDLAKGQNQNQTMMRWRRTIENDFRASIKQHRSGYYNLFHVIKVEFFEATQELHPDYFREIPFEPANSFRIIRRRMENSYRLSVIQNYMNANSKGKDLHVICFRDEKNNFLQNLTAALAEQLNVKWSIRGISESQIVADNIVKTSILN